jgi:hypothetical protein
VHIPSDQGRGGNGLTRALVKENAQRASSFSVHSSVKISTFNEFSCQLAMAYSDDQVAFSRGGALEDEAFDEFQDVLAIVRSALSYQQGQGGQGHGVHF